MIDSLLDLIINNTAKFGCPEDEKSMNFILNTCKYSIPSNVTKKMIKDRINKKEIYVEQLEKLLLIPKIEQKSEAWYSFRHNMISASDFGAALNNCKFGSQKELIIKKCEDYKVHSNVGQIEPFTWGIKYEPVACEIYSTRTNVKVYDFGVLQHPRYDFIGASPDGISELGIMLELKCPYKRKIDGKIVEQYYLQIQGQLEVCDLDECDFVEIDFKEYYCRQDFINDYDESQIYTKNNQEKGIIFEYVENNENKYHYSSLNVDMNTIFEWFKKIELSLKNENIVYKVKYWYVSQYNSQRVYRDRDLFDDMIKNLDTVWKKILEYRNNKQLYNTEILGKRSKTIIDFTKPKRETNLNLAKFSIVKENF